MNVQRQFGSDEERAARRLIEQAGAILKGLRGDMPESFVAAAVRACGRPRISRATSRANSPSSPKSPGRSSQERKPGAPKIRFEPRRGRWRRARQAVSSSK